MVQLLMIASAVGTGALFGAVVARLLTRRQRVEPEPTPALHVTLSEAQLDELLAPYQAAA